MVERSNVAYFALNSSGTATVSQTLSATLSNYTLTALIGRRQVTPN